MLWEKKDLKNPNKRGYLYLRESIYKRDKRTHTRKANKLGSGKATKERGKYTKKKDIYCGKIQEMKPISLITFEEYLALEDIKYLEFKLKSEFKAILDKFVEYILYMYGIDKKVFEKSKPKIAYELNGGYLSPITLEFITDFTIRTKNSDNKNEIERFANRCYDAGIFDQDIIMTLYTKITPEIENKEEIEAEIRDLKENKLIKQKHKTFQDFMRKQHKMI